MFTFSRIFLLRDVATLLVTFPDLIHLKTLQTNRSNNLTEPLPEGLTRCHNGLSTSKIRTDNWLQQGHRLGVSQAVSGSPHTSRGAHRHL